MSDSDPNVNVPLIDNKNSTPSTTRNGSRSKSEKMLAIATALRSVVPELSFYPDASLSTRISLSLESSKKRNRNAVSVRPSYVRFMLPDWSLDDEVQAAGLRSQRRTAFGPRLRIFGITQEIIKANQLLFTKLMRAAYSESEWRMAHTKERR